MSAFEIGISWSDFKAGFYYLEYAGDRPSEAVEVIYAQFKTDAECLCLVLADQSVIWFRHVVKSTRLTEDQIMVDGVWRENHYDHPKAEDDGRAT